VDRNRCLALTTPDEEVGSLLTDLDAAESMEKASEAVSPSFHMLAFLPKVSSPFDSIVTVPLGDGDGFAEPERGGGRQPGLVDRCSRAETGSPESVLNLAYLMNVGSSYNTLGVGDQRLLVHETTHVWQGKNSTFAMSYVFSSVLNQGMLSSAWRASSKSRREHDREVCVSTHQAWRRVPHRGLRGVAEGRSRTGPGDGVFFTDAAAR
jgi:hypothetical protein